MRNDTIRFRSATMQDADLLLEWRNDPETRNASHNTAKIKKEEHIFWLKKNLTEKNRQLLIVEENGVPVGTVRVDFSDGVYELSWTVGPNEKGRGVGKRMVSILSHQISEPIRVEIKSWNIVSARIAEYAGMEFQRETDGILHYVRTATQQIKPYQYETTGLKTF